MKNLAYASTIPTVIAAGTYLGPHITWSIMGALYLYLWIMTVSLCLLGVSLLEEGFYDKQTNR